KIAPCRVSGPDEDYAVTAFRADVLRARPLQKDADGKISGKRIVNDADLLKAGESLNTVTLPEAPAGSCLPETPGASLFVVYRDASQPLTKIVVYDGLFVQPPGGDMTQTLRGFLQSSTSPKAKVTHIVSGGAANGTDRVWFNGQQLPKDPKNPFPVAPPAGGRGWSTTTWDVSKYMSGKDSRKGYGEEASTKVDQSKTLPYGGLMWAAVVFSTTVQDGDGDGLVDRLEDVSGLKDADGSHLPDLHAMGAKSGRKDFFAEIGYMTTDGYSRPLGQGQVTKHSHRPAAAAIKMVGDAYAKNGVAAHFDLGNNYPKGVADPYVIRGWGLARGGETIDEAACVPSDTVVCQFPEYPGTVSWKIGFQLYRDQPVAYNGRELSQKELADLRKERRDHHHDGDWQDGNWHDDGWWHDDDCDDNGWGDWDGEHEHQGHCRLRFDQNRRELFHYVLFAHARGIPKEVCVTPDGVIDQNCRRTNPNFHVPSSTSGVSDLPGGDSMVTLGLWDNFVGTDFMQAS